MIISFYEISPPPELIPWLCYCYSLTERLKSLRGHSELRILNQAWIKSDWWMHYVLRLSAKTVFQREIMMFSRREPCWYARTLIPETTYSAHQALFQRLESESLGQIIFSSPNIRRFDRIYYPVDVSCIEYYWVKACYPKIKDQTLWCRLTSFYCQDAPFFLVEVFMPGLVSNTPSS